VLGTSLAEAAAALEGAVDWVVKSSATQTRAVHAGAAHYLRLWGIVASAWQLGRGALVAARMLAAGEGDAVFLRAKIATARFYAATVLPQAPGLARTLMHGGEATLELAAEQF
jgi:hypothetical protein